jgi:dipeptidyl aminopeptidase/acylaminoacyl peptidase
MDLSRVGIHGHSWGGYFTIRALLMAPEVYHVGIASAPVGDAEDSGIHEPFLGTPENNREGYEYASNTRLIKNLQGRLLLIVGTQDVWFHSVMKIVDALIKGSKPHDLLILPNQLHGIPAHKSVYAKYYWDAIRRYFLEHLKPEIN